jgi:uncharacterized membrane protein/glutaredoxin
MKKIIIFLLLTILLSSQVAVVHAQTNTSDPVVHAVMFWMDGCPHCHEVLDHVLPPLQAKYGTQFDLVLIEVSTTQDIDMLYQVAASYNITKEQTGVPFLIIGEHLLIGSQQIPDELPGLIEYYLSQGGVDLPSKPILADLLPQTSLPLPVNTAPAAPAQMQSNGFTLAIVIMVGMGLALLYSIIAFATGKTFQSPLWVDWLIPLLIALGIGVAAYLSYVETRSVEAVCGPVGDCNAVQQSRYAKLFDFLPVGVLGLLGYLGMLAAWIMRKYLPKLAKPADIAFLGMTFFAVIFSLYLTYLEPFVIRAVCIWCLASAVIVTLLLLLGIPPAVLRFSVSDHDD